MNYGVLLIFNEGHGPNAWLSINGKSRWTREGALYHARRIRNRKTDLMNVSQAIVKEKS